MFSCGNYNTLSVHEKCIRIVNRKTIVDMIFPSSEMIIFSVFDHWRHSCGLVTAKCS